jgi:3'-phosphoadenosine 5'-phosphosulfate sulfotransferase (PAPS reductase)/FAD synthetase
LDNPTTALLFSGGRDSIVLKHILDPYLDDILIIWVNTGAAYESTLKQMGQVRDNVPHFLEITTDQLADIEANGYPTDILPLRHSHNDFGYLTPRLQSTISCCSKNIWLPLSRALQDKAIKVCYIGAREEEDMKDSRWDGTRGGIEFKYPLRKWTNKMVLDYANKHSIILPPYYSQGEEKSRDCWNCTGYLWERRASIAALPFYQKQEVISRLNKIEEIVNTELGWLQGVTKGV